MKYETIDWLQVWALWKEIEACKAEIEAIFARARGDA